MLSLAADGTLKKWSADKHQLQVYKYYNTINTIVVELKLNSCSIIPYLYFCYISFEVNIPNPVAAYNEAAKRSLEVVMRKLLSNRIRL